MKDIDPLQQPTVDDQETPGGDQVRALETDAASREERGFLQLLDRDPDRAAEKYADLFLRLVKFFEWRNCRSPEDLAQETLVRGLTKVAKGADIYSADPVHYFYGIAKNMVREDRRPRRSEASVYLDDLPELASANSGSVDAQIQLDQCLSRLPAADREILVRFHTEDHPTVCQQLRLTANTLRVKAHRARKKLEKLIRIPTGAATRLK